MSLDYTYRLDIPHRPGQLAKVLGEIAAREGLIGEVGTVSVGRETSVREMTVEVESDDMAKEIAEVLGSLEGVEVEWYRDRALMLHEGGKLKIDQCREVRTVQDMRDVYTPGVARACEAIADDPAEARRLTMIGRTIAICTNGTRVLGLGDIGPVASMPVMEGKAVFYRQFAGLSAMPILIDADDPDEFCETVIRISPGFGGIHLEDIEAPACFDIEARLIDALPKPVMHDDVHGTAVVTLAAVIVACRHADVELKDSVVGQIGLGAAGYGIAGLMADAGVKRVIASDPEEATHERARERGIEIVDGIDELMGEADVVVATSGQPGLIEPSSVREDQVVLALTNPEPEIEPEAALEAGAAFAADGTSVNNVLGYPGIFKGALASGAEEINLEMRLAAARAIADRAENGELVPDVLDVSVHESVAEAVAKAAESSGAANADRVPAAL